MATFLLGLIIILIIHNIKILNTNEVNELLKNKYIYNVDSPLSKESTKTMGIVVILSLICRIIIFFYYPIAFVFEIFSYIIEQIFPKRLYRVRIWVASILSMIFYIYLLLASLNYLPLIF